MQMSDDPLSPAHDRSGVAPAGIHEHFCEHPGCTKWGGFGFSRPRETSHWFCFQHREEGERYR
jgi:hypothetical protein